MRAEEIQGLMEAYSKVNAPDVVDIAAEVWVSACIEEGVDFSQYTLDEITEAFIVDLSSEDLSESLLSEILGMPGAQNLGAGLRQQFGKARRAVGSAIGNVAKGTADVVGAGLQGNLGQRTTSSNPLARAANAASRFQTALPRAAASFTAGLITGKPGAVNPPAKPGAPAKPPTKPPAGPGGTPIRPQPGNERAPAPKPPAGPGGTPIRPQPGNERAPAPKPPTSTAAPKPTTPTAAPSKPAGSAMDQWAKANPKLAAAKAERDRTRGTSATTNPLMKDMKANLPAPKSPSPSTASTAFGLAKKGVNLAAGVDIFDLVKGHLLDEGYTDSEEGAMVIMVNMSEEWKKSILEAHGVELDENREHDREMRKAAARERAEEKRDRKEEGKKSAKSPGREGPSAGKSYADYQEISIKSHDKKTKGKHTVGNPFPEHVEYVDEAQRARENPEDHDKEEKRKYEPVRGERTPMPPRGDKRREEFEKWYAKQMGR